MEIRSTSETLNAGFSRTSEAAADSEERLNAFGIGAANQPEVELSPQARILQQNEQVQNERREALERQRAENEDNDEQPDTTTDAFVRVSSSVGTAQRSNLTSEAATELYRSIEKLI